MIEVNQFVLASTETPPMWDCDSARGRVYHYPHEWTQENDGSWLCLGFPSWQSVVDKASESIDKEK